MVAHSSMHDTFISDDEEDLCPLCIEEMDLSDKNFKPCPCGYQICQFCYNYIRNNPELTGRCPACRRPYDDESVEYKHVSAEEVRKEQARQARKEKERKQRERERKETEQQAKKNLAGVRVIQKNLVYVIGLNPSIPTDELHNTLRGEHFFGQYGKIKKIVINKRTNAQGNPGIGVYVTFERKDDAARCIASVDGSVNDGRVLRAAYGTTKYCSAYLKGQSCPNPNCMFLHEPGEEADSFSRRDLSNTMQSGNGNGNSNSTSNGHHRGERDRSSTPSAAPLPSVAAAHAHAQQLAASARAAAQQQAAANPQPNIQTQGLPSLQSHHAQQQQQAQAQAHGQHSHHPTPQHTVVPATPAVASAWGKSAVLHPTTKRAVEHSSCETVLQLLAQGVETLSRQESLSFDIHSLQDTGSGEPEDKLPALFNLPLGEKDRLTLWQESATALARYVDTLRMESLLAARKQFDNSPAGRSAAFSGSPTPALASRQGSASPSPAPAPPPGLSKAQNSGELLAHLMKDKPREATPSTTTTTPSPLPPKRTSRDDGVPIPEALVTKLNKLVDRRRIDGAGVLKPMLKPSLKQQELPTAEDVPVTADDLARDEARSRGQQGQPRSICIDDGGLFDIHNLPRPDVVADPANSVWSLLAHRNAVLQREAERDQAYAQAHATMRRIYNGTPST